ncbi:pyridoxamine 5'-phosphate oxidase family protein [Limimaricola variabilis]|jgi:general stress protein 26
MSEQSNEQRVKQFWDRLADLRAGMVGIKGTDRLVPMSHHVDAEAGCLWFIAAHGEELTDAVEAGPRDALFSVSSDKHGLYAHAHGTLELSHDKAKLDEVWNGVAASWFDDGRDDPDVRLLCLRLREAEIWTTTTSSAAFLFQIAKAKAVREAKPDVGDNYTLRF